LDTEEELDAWWPTDSDLSPLASAVALVTHHDAITGTEKQFVADDYAYRMTRAAQIADRVTDSALRTLIKAPTAADFPLVRCPELNASVCALSADNTLSVLTVVVYNPSARARAVAVRLPVADTDTDSTISVRAPSGLELSNAVLPAPPVTSLQEQGLPAGRSKQVLVFEADMPAFGARAFTVNRHSTAPKLAEVPLPYEDFVLENDHIRVEFDRASGLIAALVDKRSALRTNLTQSFKYYVADGRGVSSANIKQASGAYMFRAGARHRASPNAMGLANFGLDVSISVISYIAFSY
jgi:hypothetical protein